MEKHTKDELQGIAQAMLEVLLECPEGTVISTAQLAKKTGYDPKSFDQFGLFEIHSLLLKLAESEGEILDMTDHEKKYEGLSYNQAFVLHHKKD